jgi:hypothetical protein
MDDQSLPMNRRTFIGATGAPGAAAMGLRPFRATAAAGDFAPTSGETVYFRG